jgi:hypothetical protein
MDGVIRSSTDTARDAVLGRGVYLTSLPPSTGDWRLIKNNWDGKRSAMLNKLDKVDYYIAFDSKDLPGIMRAAGKRDVWMVPYDIDLDEVPCNVGVRRHKRAAGASAWLFVSSAALVGQDHVCSALHL